MEHSHQSSSTHQLHSDCSFTCLCVCVCVIVSGLHSPHMIPLTVLAASHSGLNSHLRVWKIQLTGGNTESGAAGLRLNYDSFELMIAMLISIRGEYGI